jgi:glycosyltransferase involved in cell wall biosynthesis
MTELAVNIVIPTYNRAEFLRAAIASVLNQTFRNVELIVVDDGSTDHTADVIRSFGSSRIVHVALERSGNLSMLRNAGIRLCSRPLVAFLDSDDLWREDKLEVQMGLLNSDPSAGFVISGYEIFGPIGLTRTKLYGKQSGMSVEAIFDDLIRGRITLCSSSILIRRKVIDQIGLLNENLRSGDYEFYTRLAWQAPAGIVHEPLVKVRKHEGNSSLQLDAVGLEEAIYAVRRFYSLGLIGRDIRDDRLAKYERELADVLSRRMHDRRARSSEDE